MYKRFILSNELGHCGERRKWRGQEREEKGKGGRRVLRRRFDRMGRRKEGRMKGRIGMRGGRLGRKRRRWGSRKGEEGRGK